MLRAYIRKIKGMSVASQHAAADKDEVRPNARYEESTGEISRTLNEAIASIRAGDMLWVADTTVLADGRTGLLRILKTLSDKNVPVREGRTGRTSLPPHDGQFMAIEAANRWSSANKKFGAMTPEDAGSLGGKTAAKHRRKLKLPKTEAAKYWFDKSLQHLDTDAITAKVNAAGRALGYKKDWTTSSLYRALGARGTYAGPKVKR